MARTATHDGPEYATTYVEPGTRPLPWNVMGGGLNAPEGATVQEAMARAGLDYDVETWGLNAVKRGVEGQLLNMVQAPANLRTIVRPMPDGGHRVLAACGRYFTPVQNRDAFSVADELVKGGVATVSGAADFHHGGASLLVARFREPITLGGRDRVDMDLVIVNHHDASGALTMALTPMRFSCTNALQGVIQGAERVWKLHHSPKVLDRVALASEAIQRAVKYQRQYETVAQSMLDAPMVDAEFAKIVSRLWPVKADEEGRKADQRREIQARVRALYEQSPTLEGIRGTRWGGYNAVTEYLDHYRNVRGGTTRTPEVARAEGALEGPNVRAKAKVWGIFARA